MEKHKLIPRRIQIFTYSLKIYIFLLFRRIDSYTLKPTGREKLISAAVLSLTVFYLLCITSAAVLLN